MGAIDLEAYFGRLGYGGPRPPTLQTLMGLHRLHPEHIPFESLDPLFGRPVLLDPASLERKLVRGRRGGYCFEQNGVFELVLAALGFRVTPLAARVRWGLPEAAPATSLSHRLMKVDLPEGPFIADVGFGGQSPTAPLRLEPGLVQATPHGTYRITGGPETYELQMRLSDRWAAMYRFTLEPRPAADYESGNWFTSTHPNSRFVLNLIAAKVDGERRLNLFNDELTTYSPDGPIGAQQLDGPAEAHALLTGTFGLDVEQADLDRVWGRLPKRLETA